MSSLLSSLRRLSVCLASSSAIAGTFLLLGSAGCANETTEETGASADELNSHASQAGIREWSAEATGVLALANDRSLNADDYVFRVRISRVTADAIIATRNGTNGINESRPYYVSYPYPSHPYPYPDTMGGGTSGSSGPVAHPVAPPPPDSSYWGCGGWGGSSGTPSTGGSAWSGSSSGDGTDPTGPFGGSTSSGGTSGSYPYPYPCGPAGWELGGDDEQFARLVELDALPGTDISGFKNLLSYAQRNGYVPYGGHATVDAGPPHPPVSVDGGSWHPPPPPPPHHVDAGSW